MKKLVAVLLVLTMALAVTSTAMAACSIKKNMWVEFKKDSPAYTDAKSSKKTSNVVQKKSTALCVKVCGDFAKICVNEAGNGIYRWFKVCDLKESDFKNTIVIWAKGGKGMSACTKERYFVKELKGKMIKVKDHTNLRKTPSLKFKSQGVVKKCDKLKMTGNIGIDDRRIIWLEVCYKGRKLWLSEAFADLSAEQYVYIAETIV